MTGNRIQRHSSNSVSIIQSGSLKPRERTAQDGPRPWKALALLPFWSNIIILQNEPALGKNWYPTAIPWKRRPREVIAIQNQNMATGFSVVSSWLLAYVSAAQTSFALAALKLMKDVHN